MKQKWQHVNKPEVLLKELQFAEMIQTNNYTSRTINQLFNVQKKQKLLFVKCTKETFPDVFVTVWSSSSWEQIKIVNRCAAGVSIWGRSSGRQQNFAVSNIWNRSSSLSLTHMNQVVIGGVLRRVQGLWLLSPAGGPRHSLFGWKETKTVKTRLFVPG